MKGIYGWQINIYEEQIQPAVPFGLKIAVIEWQMQLLKIKQIYHFIP